jgi:hypothetical protein
MVMVSMAATLGIPAASAMGFLHRLWHAVAMDPQGHRAVPAERSAWPSSRDAWVLEAGAGWLGDRGELFTLWVDSGVIELHPDAGEDAQMRVVLVGWADANRQGPGAKKLAALGGIAKARNSARKVAEGDAAELLEWYRRNRVGLHAEAGIERVKEAVIFVRQIERLMRWVPATERAFMEGAVEKSLKALDALGQDKDMFLSWLVANRGRDIIPGRVDLLLGEVGKLHAHAKSWMEAMQ